MGKGIRLPEKLRRLMWKMLREGASFEDTAEAINERADEAVSLKAVQEFFRSNARVQHERVRHQLAAAQELKRALKDPKSAQAELAEAALFTGLMALGRRGVRLTFPPAGLNSTKSIEGSKQKAAGRRQL